MDTAASTVLTDRAATPVRPGHRAILGICGAPEAGKSGLATTIGRQASADLVV